MKFSASLACAMLALIASGCATNDSTYVPYPSSVVAESSDCSHTRKMSGQRCHVVRSDAEKRRLLRGLGMR